MKTKLKAETAFSLNEFLIPTPAPGSDHHINSDRSVVDNTREIYEFFVRNSQQDSSDCCDTATPGDYQLDRLTLECRKRLCDILIVAAQHLPNELLDTDVTAIHWSNPRLAQAATSMIEYLEERFSVSAHSGINKLAADSAISVLVNERLTLHTSNWPIYCYDNPAAIRAFVSLTLGDTQQASFIIGKRVVAQILALVKHLSSNLHKKYRLMAVQILSRIYKSIDHSMQNLYLDMLKLFNNDDNNEIACLSAKLMADLIQNLEDPLRIMGNVSRLIEIREGELSNLIMVLAFRVLNASKPFLINSSLELLSKYLDHFQPEVRSTVTKSESIDDDDTAVRLVLCPNAIVEVARVMNFLTYTFELEPIISALVDAGHSLSVHLKTEENSRNHSNEFNTSTRSLASNALLWFYHYPDTSLNRVARIFYNIGFKHCDIVVLLNSTIGKKNGGHNLVKKLLKDILLIKYGCINKNEDVKCYKLLSCLNRYLA